jgi:membrane associated rhomboid family serine protease
LSRSKGTRRPRSLNPKNNVIVIPPVIQFLLILNTAVFLAQGFADSFFLQWFALWPLSGPFWPWQLVTYAFLHGGLLHLFLNMFALWMFGMDIEQFWGSRAFALYYFVCVVGAALVQLLVSSMAASQGFIYPTIGASGGVFGILLAFGMTFPNRPVMLLFPPIPMKAKWLVIGYGAIELWSGVTGTAAGVAHFAHLGGMLFGFLLIQYWRGGWPWRSNRRFRR